MATTTTPRAKAYAGLASAVAAIVAAVFAVEGGYVNNPADPGGATNHGVTERVARSHGYKGDMQDLPREFADWVYRADYIDKPGFAPVIQLSPAVGHKVVDAGVNAGPTRAARWYQQALSDLSRAGQDYPRPAVDGRIGPATLAAYQALQRKRGPVKACELTIKLIDAQQAHHYTRALAMPAFVVGWVDHRIGNVPLARCADRVE